MMIFFGAVIYIVWMNVFSIAPVRSLEAENIINNNVVTKNQYPEAVIGVCFYEQRNLMFSGTIVRNKYVLTAGHNVLDPNNDPFKDNCTITAGATGLDDNSKTREDVKVAKIFVLTQFLEQRKHIGIVDDELDIAVLKLERGFKNYKKGAIHRAYLPVQPYSNFLNQKVHITGAGVYSVIVKTDVEGRREYDFAHDKKLRSTEGTIVDFMQCSNISIKQESVNQYICVNTSSFMCAGDSGAGAIIYDRGVKTVVGILSYSQDDCQLQQTVFIKVTFFMDFIEKVLKNKVDSSITVN